MRKKLLEYSWRKWIAFSFCLGVIIGFWACESDHLVDKAGLLRLSLNADTTSLKSGVNNMTKTYSDEFADFLTTSDYKIQITQDTGIICSYERFDKMPSEIELKKGSYMLVASKGDNLPAAFENPYFEGKKNFVIKEDMTTPLDVTCTLGNARITTVFTDDFKEAYSDYTVLLSTDYTDEEIEIVKDEYRPLYMQAAEEGTAMAIGIRLKKVTEETEKTYYVPTTLDIFRRQNIRLIFRTDGEAFEGIGLDVELDDTLEPMTFTTKIPQFMWNQFDKPTLEAVDFPDGNSFKIRSGELTSAPSIGIVMPGGIGSLVLKYWKEGEPEEEAVIYDLATDAGVEAAKGEYYTWTVGEDKDINMAGAKAAVLYLQQGINSLKASADGDCLYHVKVYGSDATGKATASNTISFDVTVIKADEPLITATPKENNFSIVEGDALDEDWKFTFAASGSIDKSATKVSVSTGGEYYFMANETSSLESMYGVDVNIVSGSQAVLTFPKEFTMNLKAPESGNTDYTFTFYLKDEQGKECTLIKTVTVQSPVFALETTDGDAFARRIVLRASLTTGTKDNLSFQYRKEGELEWNDVASTGLKEDNSLFVDTLRNSSLDTDDRVIPGGTVYELKAVYNRYKDFIRHSNIVKVSTESIGSLPNPGFEHWSLGYDTGDPASNAPALAGTVSGIGSIYKNLDSPYRFWEIWLPWDDSYSSSMGWNTLNKFTTSDGEPTKTITFVQSEYPWTRYNANSGTIPNTGWDGTKAALIRTVGWGRKSSAGGENTTSAVIYSTPGELYLGNYDENVKLDKANNVHGAKYGISFDSRPSGFIFDYNYINPMSGNDAFIAEIVVLDVNSEIIAKTQIEGAVTTSWVKGNKVMLKYDGDKKLEKANKMYIRFVSGKVISKGSLGSGADSEYPTVPPFSDLGSGEFTGSELYIDNVKLIYE